MEKWEPIRQPFGIEGVVARWFRNESGTAYRLEAETLREFGPLGRIKIVGEYPSAGVEAPDGPDLIRRKLEEVLHEKVTLGAMG